MDKLPSEIIYIIISRLKNYIDIYSLKIVCKEYNHYIHHFSLIKMKLCNKLLLNNKKKLNKCININCCKDTKELFLSKYRHYNLYIHRHQSAMNIDTIYINSNDYKVYSPYCCECFKENILIKDITKNKVLNHYCEGFIDIEYL